MAAQAPTHPSAAQPPTEPTDPQIIASVLGGNSERYGELVERYQRMLYAVAWSRLGERELCEDVVQEAFLQGYRFLPALRSPERFAGWIAQIARNLCRRLIRLKASEREQLRRFALERPGKTPADSSVPPATAPTPGNSPESAESLEDNLRQLLETMPDSQRESLVLFYVQGKSVRECAQALALSESAFKTRLHRARRLLRGMMEERLEQSLRQMRPASHTRSRVMALLPAAPLGSGMKLAGPGAFASLGSFVVLPWIFNMLLLGGWLGWLNKKLADNYREQEALRRRILWRNSIVFFVTTWTSVLLLSGVMAGWGLGALFGACALLMGINVPAMLWQYRVTPTPFVRAQALSYPLITLLFLGGATGLLPLYSFMAGFVLLSVLSMLARSSMPHRNDYNLFLRAGMDTLKRPEITRARLEPPLSREQLTAFARLLGKRYLVADRYWNGPALRLVLPGVYAEPLRNLMMLPARLGDRSWVELSPTGGCRAYLSRSDRKALRKLNALQAQREPQLQQQVESAVAGAVGAFARGDELAALGWVEPQSDAEGFRTAPHNLRSQKLLYAVSISAGVLFLIIEMLLHHVWGL
jgi:RNA polymerase sigma-70 factor (ECF subfamily)